MDLLTHKKYAFASSALAEDDLAVVSFTGDEGISRLFVFDLQLCSKKLDIDLQAVLGRPASFTLHRPGGGKVTWHGMVCGFELQSEFDGLAFYRATLVPRLWWLSLTRHNQVFLDKSVPAILREVLLDGGLTTDDFEFRLQADYPPREFVCQYQESHLDFLSRWLEHEGICYFFEHGGGADKVVFADALAAHKDLPEGGKVAYRPASGLNAGHEEEVAKAFSGRFQAVPAKVLLKDYDYRRPSLELEGRADVDDRGRGLVFLYGEHFRTPGDGSRLANLRKEELLCRRTRFAGSGSVPVLAPGFLFQLEHHFRSDYNRKYLAVEVRHEGSQSGAFPASALKALGGAEAEVFYRNEFAAIPSDLQYRPARETPIPRVAGFVSARIDAAGTGALAELDPFGRYKVQLPFDLSGRKDAKASAWLRMAQPYAGGGHGMHFPLHKGTEVLLTFMDGDPDRPVIASAVPNAACPSPVLGANQSTNRIVSAAGNEIHLEDQAGSERILMHVPAKASYVRVGAPNDPDTGQGGDKQRDEHETAQDGIRSVAKNQLWLEEDDGSKTGLTGGILEVRGNVGQGVAGNLPSDADLQRVAAQAHATCVPPEDKPANPANPGNTATGVWFTFSDVPAFAYRDGALFDVQRGPAYRVRLAGVKDASDHDRAEVGLSGTLVYGKDANTASTAPTPAWTKVDHDGCGLQAGDTLVEKRYGNAYTYVEGETMEVRKGGMHTVLHDLTLHEQTFSNNVIASDHTIESGGKDTKKTYDSGGVLLSTIETDGNDVTSTFTSDVRNFTASASGTATFSATAGGSSTLACNASTSFSLTVQAALSMNIVLSPSGLLDIQTYLTKLSIESGLSLWELKHFMWHLESKKGTELKFADVAVRKTELSAAKDSIKMDGRGVWVHMCDIATHLGKLVVHA